MPSRRSKKYSPAKLAGRMKRRWRVVLLRNKGKILGTVEAAECQRPKLPQRSSLNLDRVQRSRIPPKRTLLRCCRESF
jgi:hypothetical protein